MKTPGNNPPWKFDGRKPDEDGVIEVERDPSPADEQKDLRTPEEIKSTQLDNREKEENLTARTDYANKAYQIVWTWTVCIILVTLIQFFAKSAGHGLHHLSFIAIVVSTSGLMFGFWALVGRYLFPSPKKE